MLLLDEEEVGGVDWADSAYECVECDVRIVSV